MSFEVRPMLSEDLDGVVALQVACFPPPFPSELLWQETHLAAHLEKFPGGQFVAIADGQAVASASNTRITLDHFDQHLSWAKTVGGPFLETFESRGAVMYGLDISVHPDWRRRGIAKSLYQARFDLVGTEGIELYATACRLPGFASWGPASELEAYLDAVQHGRLDDVTLTPLLKMGLTLVTGLRDYMEDAESHDCAALLEWKL